MYKVFAAALTFVVGLSSMPIGVVTAAQGPTGGVQGVAKNAQQRNLPGMRVQVRAANGQLAASGSTDANGAFSLAGLNPGKYTIELVDAEGNIVGTSVPFTIAAGAATVTTVTVTADAAGAIGAGVGGGLSLFGLGQLATVAVLGAAGAASVAAIVVTRKDVSPSR